MWSPRPGRASGEPAPFASSWDTKEIGMHLLTVLSRVVRRRGFIIAGLLIALCLPVAVHAGAGPSGSTLQIVAGSGYYNSDTGHYYYALNRTDWQSAENEAKSLGGHLVTINDQAE